MSPSTDTRALIAEAVERFGNEVPALQQLKLVIRLELRARGDVPIWRVEVPGPKISRDPAADARLDVSLARSHFNELAADGRLRDWIDAYERGHLRVSGDPAVTRLLGNVIQRQVARRPDRPHRARTRRGSRPRFARRRPPPQRCRRGRPPRAFRRARRPSAP